MKWKDEGPVLGAKPPLIERIFRRFSPKRGLMWFLGGLAISPIYIFINSIGSEEFHWDGALLVMILFATVAGAYGLFSNEAPPL